MISETIINVCNAHGLELSSYCEAKGCGAILCFACYKHHKCPHYKNQAIHTIPQEFLSCYYFLKYLGKGSFGSVFCVKDREDGVPFALKVISDVSQEVLPKVSQEIQLMTEISHANIVKYFNSKSYPEKEMVIIGMELCEGSLSEIIHQIDFQSAMKFFWQICQGVSFLHHKNIIHRDLKPGNILYKDQTMKLCDFGEAREIKNGHLTMSNTFGFGTPEYLAPEVLAMIGKERSKYTEKADIWALGIILHKMLSRNKHPFFENNHNREDYWGVISSKEMEISPLITDERALFLLRRCLEKDPRYRADIEEVIKILGNQTKNNKPNNANSKMVEKQEKKKKEKFEKKEKYELLWCLEGLSAEAWCVQFSHDGSKVLGSFGKGNVYLWDFASGEVLKKFECKSYVNGVCFSKTKPTKIYCGSYNHGILEFDLSSAKLLRTLDHFGSLICMDISPNGMILATGSGNKCVLLWDIRSGKPVAQLLGHQNHVNSVSFSPDGELIASGSNDETIKCWELASGKLIATLEGNTSSVESIHFDSDARRLVSGALDGSVKLWDAYSGSLIGELEGHSECVRSVKFSNDKSVIVSGSYDKIIKVWDATSGEIVQNLEGHLDHVNSIAMSRDGSKISSASEDCTIRLWEKMVFE